MDSRSEADTPWREGDRVLLRGSACTVTAVTPYDDCISLRVGGDDLPSRTLLVPFDRPRRIARSVSARRVRLRRWLHIVRRAACRAEPFGGVIDPVPPSFDLLPYQLEPTIACLREGATRLLVADAVGLGKTVQAGLLLHSLAARNPSFRALVVTPAGLRLQWADELSARFGLPAVVTDADWLRRSVYALPADVAPWSLPGIYVVSFDFLKRPEVLRPIEDLAWDVIVVDEAHNLGTGTARRAAVQAAAMRSMRVVLLTATPHAGDAEEYRALCAIGAAGPHEPIVRFRRSRAEVGVGSARRSRLLTVAAPAAERRLHRLIDRYTSALCREAGAGDRRPRLLAVVIKKRALSSAAAFAISIRRRLDLLSGESPISQLPLPLDGDDRLDDDVADDTLSAPGLIDGARERRLLKQLADAAEAVAPGSKSLFLVRMLRRIREPAIVFTEYRDTLARLHDLLIARGHAVSVLHGGQTTIERAGAQREFNQRGGVLLATDAASEGLNLHEHCRLVVHYELPWSPARMEQRTGRVDRLGQRATVHEVLLVAGDPAERLVLAPLARRAALARRAMGPLSDALDRLAERAVADAVLEGNPELCSVSPEGLTHRPSPVRQSVSPEGLTHGPTPVGQGFSPDALTDGPSPVGQGFSPVGQGFSPDALTDGPSPVGQGFSPDLIHVLDLRTEATAEAERLAERRAWRTRSPRIDRPDPDVIVARAPCPSRLPNLAVCLLSLSSPGGRVEHQELVVVPGVDHVSVLEQERGAAMALAAFQPRLRRIEQAHAQAQAAQERRARGLRGLVVPASRALVQAGLFDRRAIRWSDERTRAASELAAMFDRASRAAANASALTAALELVAILKA